MKLNDEQKNIIEEGLGKNLLVSAAAGSGKTMVLTERIVRKVIGENCDGKDISLSNILVMTFTKKATAEMKARIKKKIEEKMGECDNVRKLIRESSTIQNANISTIDAFCKKILEENYTALTKENSLYYDFDLTYRIADTKEMAVLLDDVIDEFLESEYLNKKYRLLFDAYIDKTDEGRLKELLKSALLKLSSVTWPDEYLSRQILDFEKNSKTAYDEYVASLLDEANALKKKTEKYLTKIYEMANLFKSSLDSGKNENGKDITANGKKDLQEGGDYLNIVIKFLNDYIASDFKLKNGSIDIDVFKDIYKGYNESLTLKQSFPRVTYVNGLDKSEYDAFKGEYKKFIDEFELIEKVYTTLNFTDSRIYNKAEKVFLEFLREFYLLVITEKRKRNMYEISDYSHMALDILYDKNVDKNGYVTRTISKKAQEIGSRYELIFIDEYQDTNFVQEKILEAISDGFSKGNIFMVGDVKQSIYGFRSAEPSIFVNKYHDFENNKGGINKTLSINYRSTKEIVGYVNDLFLKAMTPKFGDIDYSVDNALGFTDEEKNRDIIEDNKVEIHVVYKGNEDKKDNSAIDYEADFVASEIEKLVREKKCKYSDIVILLRSVKNKVKVYEEALKKHKVPSCAEQKTGFFERLEVKLMTDILSIVDNPLQNVPLAAVLESNVFNFNNDELAFIKLVAKEKYIYDSILYIDNFIKNDVESVDTEKKEEYEKKIKKYKIDEKVFTLKIDNFLTKLSDLQFRARYLNISNLIEYIYRNLHIKEIVSAMTDGRQRKVNLETLYNLAIGFENSSYYGLFNFNRYIEKINEVAMDQGQAKVYDENSDAVRIMTLHTSKGLQFKTVFLCNCNADYNFMDSSEKTDSQFDQDYAFGLDYYDFEEGYKCNSAKKLLIASKKLNETKQEELRMLYVALTRAEKKLYITGAAGRKGGKGFTYKSLCEFIDRKNEGKNMDLDISDCRNYLDVVLSNYPVNDERYCKFYDHEWDIQDVNEDDDDISIEEASNEVRNEKDIKAKDKEYFEAVSEKSLDDSLNDNYYYADYQKLKAKFSVSSIKNEKHKAMKDKKVNIVIKDEDDIDDVVLDKRDNDKDCVNGQEIGNAYHRYMQFYDYNEGKYRCDKEKNSLAESVVDKSKVEAFVKSKLGMEMSDAFKDGRLYREQKFMKLYTQSEINNYMYNEEDKILDIKKEILNDKNVIIQGIIDAFYVKKDKDGNEYIVLVDYKTDSLSKKEINRELTRKVLTENYKIQLDIYADAIKEITGMDVKEKYLYSFALDEMIEV